MFDLKTTYPLTTDDIEFLVNLADELKTQNTHGTRTPIYLQVREPKRTIGTDPSYGDGETFVIGDDYQDFYSAEDVKAHLIDQYGFEYDDFEGVDSFEDFEVFCADNLIRASHTGYSDGHEYHEFFLTQSGFQQHMKLNGHNYRKNTSFYVRHLDRNPELERLLTIVEKFATVVATIE